MFRLLRKWLGEDGKMAAAAFDLGQLDAAHGYPSRPPCEWDHYRCQAYVRGYSARQRLQLLGGEVGPE